VGGYTAKKLLALSMGSAAFQLYAREYMPSVDRVLTQMHAVAVFIKFLVKSS